MRWLAIVLQALLGAMFLFSAFLKLTGGAHEIRLHLGIPPWFWTVTALVEVVGAISLLAGLRVPRLAAFGGLWLGATMTGGILAHVRAGDPFADAVPAATLGLLALAVAALRWRDARVGALLTAHDDAAADTEAAAR